MAIYQPKSQFVDSTEAPLQPGVVVLYAGQAMVRTSGSQSLGCLPSTGAATDIFVGFANIQNGGAVMTQEPFDIKVEEFTVPATSSLTLGQTPLSLANALVYDVTNAAPITANVALTGNVLSGSGLVAGTTVRVTYKYALTVLQAQAKYGNISPGGFAGNLLGSVGLGKRGRIYLNAVNAGINWAAATAVKLAAGGQLTDQTGSGVVIPASIIEVPSIESPYLGLDFTTNA